MASPTDPTELDLIRRAIILGQSTGGCCEWREAAARRIRERPPVAGLTPDGIKRILCDYVASQGGEIIQVPEKRAEYRDYRFYYKVILPVPDLSRGLFVELVLADNDPTYPVAVIVNAHPQTR